MEWQFQIEFVIAYGIVQAITVLIFVYLSFSNPGFLKSKLKIKATESLLQLLKEWECFEICPECIVVKVSRSRHCDFCNNCVKVYDHHCPWIDNCVAILFVLYIYIKIGSENHCTFYLFVFLISVNISLSFAL